MNSSDIAPRRDRDEGKLIKGFSNLTFWWYSVLFWLSQGSYICAAKDGMSRWVLKLQHTQNSSLRIFIWQAIVRRPSVSTEGLFYFVKRCRMVLPTHRLPFSKALSFPPFPCFFPIIFLYFCSPFTGSAGRGCSRRMTTGAIAQLVRAQDS